jgi:hypothetical protein
MASIVMRVRLMSGDYTDVEYEEPDVDEDELIERAVATLSGDSRVLRCRQGDRLIMVFSRSVATVELSPRGAIL